MTTDLIFVILRHNYNLPFNFMPHIIIGLGNPGEEYSETRHNTGRIILESFRKDQKFPEWEENPKLKSLASEGKIGKERVVLLMPETFMNKSGEAVGKIKDLKFKVKDKKKEVSNLVVVHDELDIPFGKFKISFNKSSGGHKGVESVMKALKTEGFVRVRVGISPANAKGAVKKPQGEEAVGDFILGKFKKGELEGLKKISKKTSEAIAMIVAEGRGEAMGKFNSQK